MYSEIIEAAFMHDGEIFGGYVRDLIAGEAPKDIDIKFKNSEDAFKFISHISLDEPVQLFHDLRNMKSRQTSWENRYYGVDVYKLQVTNPMMRTLLVDVVIGSPWEHADLDVNTLCMNHDRIYKGHYLCSFQDIIKSIRQRKAHYEEKLDAWYQN